MARPSTVLLRRLSPQARLPEDHHVVYCETPDVGIVIDTLDVKFHKRLPIALERLVAGRMWEAVEHFKDLHRALPRAKAAKTDPSYFRRTLRLRDRRTNDIIMADVLI